MKGDNLFFEPRRLQIIVLLIVTGLAFDGHSAFSQETSTTNSLPVLTLQAAIDRGVQNYPGLDIVRKATEISNRQLQEAKHSWILPKFEVTSLFGPAPDVPASAGPPTFSAYTEDLSEANGVFFRLQAEALQPLYTFGRLKRVTNLARTGVKASSEDERNQLHELILNIKKVYFGMMALYTIQDFLKEIEEKLNSVEKRIDELLAKSAPDVTESDRLKVKIFSADLMNRQLETRENLQKLRYGMALLLGMGDHSDDWEIDQRNITAAEVEPFDLEQVFTWVKQNNADLKRVGYLVDAKKALMDIEQANMMPLFFLGGTFAYAVAPGRFDVENPFLNDPFNELTGGVALGLKQDLDLHILRDHYLKAKLEYEQALFQKRLAEDAIMADVRSRYLSADIGQKRLSIVTEGLRASRSWVSAEMNNYEFGLIPTKDVLEAFIAFAKTKLEFVDATVKYDLAVAALTRVTFRELLPLKYQGDGR